MNDPYELIAELYDAEHDGFEEDIDLLLAVGEELDGPILELGSGSGRLLLPLAESGHRVTGLDLSSVMLARARRRLDVSAAADLVNIVELDMRAADQAPGGSFALAVFSLNGFMHLTTQADQLSALGSVQRSLAHGGSVLLDLMNPTPDYLARIADSTIFEWRGRLEDGRVVHKWAHREVGVHEQTIETSIWYDLTAGDGQVTRIHTDFVLRYVHSSELALMLNMTGFGSPVFYGSYALDSLDAQSDRMIVAAEKLP